MGPRESVVGTMIPWIVGLCGWLLISVAIGLSTASVAWGLWVAGTGMISWGVLYGANR